MTKKKIPVKRSGTPPGVEYSTVGSGVTKRTRWTMPGPSTPEGMAAYRALLPPPGVNALEWKISLAEKIAKRVLEAAKLPTDPSHKYNIPGNDKATLPSSGNMWSIGNLTELVKAHGKREYEDVEWYGAEVLVNLQYVRNAIVEGDALRAAAYGVGLGALIREAEIRYGIISEYSRKGGETDKHLPPVAALVRSLIRKNRNANARGLWTAISTDDFHGNKIKGYKFFRNGERLLALVIADDGNWQLAGKPLTFRAFQKRVTEARKPTTR